LPNFSAAKSRNLYLTHNKKVSFEQGKSKIIFCGHYIKNAGKISKCNHSTFPRGKIEGILSRFPDIFIQSILAHFNGDAFQALLK
jgi:hypothetical protein